LRFLDFFSGIGGFRLGMEMAGHECVGHCEIDKFADKSYRAMRDVKESEWYANDIRSVLSDELPEADCWCGGFPCQAFSVAGKRRGFEDMRGTLIFEIFRLAQQRKPSILFLENVAGLLNHDGGRTFGTILCGLWELGYDVQWQVLNSKNFGVPQNRERVFIIGYLGTGSGQKVFPIYGTDGKALKQVGDLNIEGRHESACRVYDINGTGPCLNTCGGGGLETKVMIPATINKETDMDSIQLKDIGKDIANCIVSREHKGIARSSNVIIQAVLTPDREEKRQNGRRFKEDGEEMFTLTAQDKHGIMISGIYTKVSKDFQRGPLPGLSRSLKANTHDASVTDGARIRRLTPRECFRLQGFPDEYFERAAAVNSDSQLYKQAGNSVTVNVIYEIAKRL
jgi:DNA (cytosine-5)-methyltransferase 1